ncbi:MAG: hypothetical protein U0670_20215 [Anaerolineae bacterium]
MSNRSDQTFGGVFLIGLAILFLTGWWWPGIMFVIGAAILARTYAEGHDWQHPDARGGLIVIVIGLIFATNLLSFLGSNILAIVLILLGVYMLFGNRLSLTDSKRKDDDIGGTTV